MIKHYVPSLDRLEELLVKHNGDCPQPCDGCDLAAEARAVHRIREALCKELERHISSPKCKLDK